MVCLADHAKISRLTNTKWRHSCRPTLLSRFTALAFIAISVEASRDEQEAAQDRNFHLEEVSRSSRSAPYEGAGAAVRERLNQAADGLEQKAEEQARVTGDVSQHIEKYHDKVKEIGMSVKKIQQAQRELSTAYQQDVADAEPDRVRPLDLDGTLAQILQNQGDELRLNRGFFHGGKNSSLRSFEEAEDIPQLSVVGDHVGSGLETDIGGRRNRNDDSRVGDGLEISSDGRKSDTAPHVYKEEDDIVDLDKEELERMFDLLVKEKLGMPTKTIDGEPPPPVDLNHTRPSTIAKVDQAVFEWLRLHPGKKDIPDEWKKRHGYPEDDSYIEKVQDSEKVGAEVNPGMGILHDVSELDLEHHHHPDDELDEHHPDDDDELTTQALGGWTGQEDEGFKQMKQDHQEHLAGHLKAGSLVQVEDEAGVPPVADNDADMSEEKEYTPPPQEYTPRHHRRASHRRQNPWNMALASSHKRHRHRRSAGIDDDIEPHQIRHLSSHRPQDGDRYAYQRLSEQNHRRHHRAMELQPRSFRYERGYRPTSDSEGDDLGPERYDLGRHRHSMDSEYRPRHHARRYD